jgi:DNA-binding NarL/FixJ family response regulator
VRPQARSERQALLQITPWERHALQLLAERKAQAEIASRLGVSDAEIGPQLAALFEKMGASSRNEAIASAQRRGLIALDEEAGNASESRSR